MNLTLEILNKVAGEMEKRGEKVPVIFFSPVYTVVLEGELVDKLLECKENEKGFIVPESYRNNLNAQKSTAPWGYSFIEREPSLNWIEKVIQP